MKITNPIGRCLHCGQPIHYTNSFCSSCANEGWRETTQNQCGHCHAYLKSDDRYCRICGTKVGDGAYAPYQDLMQCIYGPEPVDRKHICHECGYTWTTCAMIDSEKYCPRCGGYAPYDEPYQPYQDLMQTIYGPPPTRRFLFFWKRHK